MDSLTNSLRGTSRRRAESALHSVIPMEEQSILLPGGERISHLCQNGELLCYRFEDAQTLYEAFQCGKGFSNDGDCLGWREDSNSPYQWISYSKVEERFMNFGS
ncbi:PREDICTED: long-chain-fatty-acid--CoA ligase 5-like, partial [Amphimedon queenslandica]|uniref:Uncharacterized protein n=2 Tax=Amphimedon queenslandica TaxID=400682 RepID=A0AAN0JYP4_AMPQE